MELGGGPNRISYHFLDTGKYSLSTLEIHLNVKMKILSQSLLPHLRLGWLTWLAGRSLFVFQGLFPPPR